MIGWLKFKLINTFLFSKQTYELENAWFVACVTGHQLKYIKRSLPLKTSLNLFNPL